MSAEIDNIRARLVCRRRQLEAFLEDPAATAEEILVARSAINTLSAVILDIDREIDAAATALAA